MTWANVGKKSKLDEARKEAHRVFDLLWQEELMTRSQAYAWLAAKRGEVTHMTDLDEAGCADVIMLVNQYLLEGV